MGSHGDLHVLSHSGLSCPDPWPLCYAGKMWEGEDVMYSFAAKLLLGHLTTVLVRATLGVGGLAHCSGDPGRESWKEGLILEEGQKIGR